MCVCQRLINKGKERQRELVTFFPGGTRFWLVLRMCVRAFLMFFSFMLDSTAGGRNSDKPHSFLLREDWFQHKADLKKNPSTVVKKQLQIGRRWFSDKLLVTEQNDELTFRWRALSKGKVFPQQDLKNVRELSALRPSYLQCFTQCWRTSYIRAARQIPLLTPGLHRNRCVNIILPYKSTVYLVTLNWLIKNKQTSGLVTKVMRLLKETGHAHLQLYFFVLRLYVGSFACFIIRSTLHFSHTEPLSPVLAPLPLRPPCL